MPDNSPEFRQRLLNMQEVSNPLRDNYQKELDAMLRPALTGTMRATGIVLALLLVLCTVGIVRSMLVYHPHPLTIIGWAVLSVAFASAAYLILRDLWRGTHSRKSQYSIASILTIAAGTITVVTLIHGVGSSSNPKSMFDAFYVFVFYFACVSWGLETRITNAELAAREQMLRIEYRLTDLAERLQK